MKNTRIVEYNDSMYDKLHRFIARISDSKIELSIEILICYGKIRPIIVKRQEIQGFIWYCKKCSEGTTVNEFDRACELKNILLVHIDIYKMSVKNFKVKEVSVYNCLNILWSKFVDRTFEDNEEIEKFIFTQHDHYDLPMDLLKNYITKLDYCNICGMMSYCNDLYSNVIIAKHIIAHIMEAIPLQSLKCHKSEK